MALNLKKRLVVTGVVLGASLFTLAIANAQIDPNTGAPVTPGIPPSPPGLSPSPGTTPTTPPPLYAGDDGGTGGSGMIPTYPSPFDSADSGIGGGGLMPSPILGELDAGLR
ncbi:hypothetical protein [Archangium lansingense]|uniref:Uncharacterized protein n=1 Tax=Archangium lansingense TaxID=2995310 RepID=A0ABT4A1U1_9BACT|nr:hypothetical protein [Archangium lansinium]MCY1075605.1 hypothetical protein [Archangium lansinium]